MSSKPRIDLTGVVVIITGGGRGIGAATAQAFSARGAHLWIGDIDTDIACATAASIPHCRSARLDVTSAESWREFLAEVIEEEGRIDILVNNAGVMPLGGFIEETQSTTDLILDVNVRGVINGMRAVLPSMAEAGRGHIVNVASMAGMIPIPGMVTYNGSKFAALGLSLAARHEYAGTGVTVTAVLPSAVRTELSSGATLGKGMPTVDPEDVARAVVDSVRRRPERVSVPGWVAPGWSLVRALVPRFIENVLRRLVDDRRALNGIDPEGRRAYLDRIERHAREHTATAETTSQRSLARKTGVR
ncbi:SDR family oxidoreductase [Prauserella halophila]|uniref:SDR family oxidoreductase n=1 Tax=Prauserella halophila TaxID=185641 RepID=A0ABN1WMX4_9PSEU|nr:SDR family oxidoreductase [Prauserella halophila]MCP2237736.1 Short-chain dehydrogenase [Prauserella halophila]